MNLQSALTITPQKGFSLNIYTLHGVHPHFDILSRPLHIVSPGHTQHLSTLLKTLLFLLGIPPTPHHHKQPLCRHTKPLCGSIHLKTVLENNFQSPMFISPPPPPPSTHTTTVWVHESTVWVNTPQKSTGKLLS